uniref:Adenylate kinase 9 n=1 Tax=Propithecus coquereli TaxID=379532 RepID=A0A2K6GFB4_PROCO
MISQEKTEEHPFADIFSEDETEKNFLLSKPVCFVVFGKPGVGKTTLAHHITQAWKCIRVEALSVLEEQIAAATETGVMVQSLLLSGQSVPDELITKLMLEKLNSPEVSHFGYIITEIPSLSQDTMTTLQQIEVLKNLNLKPDIIINIKCPDYDLCQRISGQRQHSNTGYIYTRDQWDPEVIESRRKRKKEALKEGKVEEEGEEEEEQEEEEAFLAEMQMVAEILHHLVQRPEDYLENVENVVKLYKETILHFLEEMMAEHDPQYLIELDGNKPPDELFTIVVDRLKYLNLKKAAVLTKLQGAEEEINDSLETEELFRTFASYKLIAPRYRWQRSKWGRLCPMNLKEGNICSGSPDFVVSFLGKMYCLSSEETLKTFLLNPRPCLLPPMPAPPCKVFIFGPEFSGKTTLSNLLAEYYKGKVVDYTELVQPRFNKARETLMKNTIAAATEAAIKVVREKLLTELQAKKQVMEENKDRFSGAPKHGGWIVDNCPIVKELWMVIVEKGIIPDLIIYLSDTENNGKCLLNRLYLENKSEIDAKILERLLDELQKKKKEEEEARKATEEALRLEEENQRLLEAMNVKTKEAEEPDEAEEESEGEESEVHDESEPPEVSEETRGSLLPDESEVSEVPETERDSVVLPEFPEDSYPDVPEMEPFKEKVNSFILNWKQLEAFIHDSFIQILNLEIADRTPKELLQKVVETMEKPFQYTAWELGVEDYDEETEDYQAEGELDEEPDEEEEEEEEVPPLRICLVGPHGCGKTTCGRQLAEKLGIFHIQFEEVLQEKLMFKTEKKVGPEFEEDLEEELAVKQELEELAIQANVKIEEENTKKLPPEVQLTEEEEVIKASLMENEPLPPEILDVILSEWWLQEPMRSTGFILDGFPRHPEEALFLGERGFFPDAAVFIQVDDQDIFDRLLPSRVAKWKLKQKKKLERKKLIKDMKTKIREDMIAKRRAELMSEREKKRKGESSSKEDEDISEEEPEDDEDDIDNILEEEFPKDEEEMTEEDEQESEAIERLRGELGEKFEADLHNLQIIQDDFEKFLIPIILINGARKIHIVQYMLNLRMKPLVENRASIFEKCYPISTHIAQKMLNFTYKYTSSFGYWDPVKLSEGETIKPVENAENPVYPVIHRQYIYFLSSKETKEKFMKNPIKYIRQPKPKPTVPIKIIIVGPPKSGKTTVAKKIASEYGLKRLSIGDTLRYILNHHPETELALMLNWHLHKGMTAPDELAIQALELSLMDSVCNTAGVVIDGYPVTTHQVNLLEARSVIPMVVFELDVPSKEIFKRLLLEKKSQQSLPYPLHNSTQIIAVKNAKYRKNIGEIRQYYQEQHQNWYVIDGFHNKWWVWNEIIKKVQMVNKYMQTYLERIKEGKAACIDKLCITPQELISRLGEFGQFCPVSLAETCELLDCSVTDSLEFAAEFRGHYYKMNSQEKLNKFLENPELYVPPLAPHPLPSADMLPKRLTLSELKSRFPKCAELQGYCPVTYQDGKQRYEALVPGNINYAAEYRDRIYICENKEKLQKFLRSPMKYWDQKLPHKLPPLREPIILTSLPLPGYLEQGIATSLIKAMNAAGCLKPKFPFLSIRRSALVYIAFHLKAFNPKGSEYTRKKYKKKMEQFVERCELITYLGAKMTRKYKEPQFRAIDFDHKLQTFLSLQNIDPISG